MKIKLLLFGVFVIFDVAFAAKRAAKFVSEIVNDRTDITAYKKIGRSSYFGLFGRNSRTQCSEVCLNEDSCESFYMDGEACVFGVSGDVTVFQEGETANPNGNQRIQAKGVVKRYFSEVFANELALTVTNNVSPCGKSVN